MFFRCRQFLLARLVRMVPAVAFALHTPVALLAQGAPAPVNFGSVALGSASPTQTFDLTYPQDVGTPVEAGPQNLLGFSGFNLCIGAAPCFTSPVAFRPVFPGLTRSAIGVFVPGIPTLKFTGLVPVFGVGLGPEIAVGPGVIATRVGGRLGNANLQSMSGLIYQPRYGRVAPSYYVTDPASNRLNHVPGNEAYGSTDGSPGFGGDGGPVIKARFNNPTGLAFDPVGNILVADTGNGRIRQISIRNSAPFTISTIAGNGSHGVGGDGGLATNASLESPSYIAVGSTGDIYISDSLHSVVRVISATTGVISRFAGTAGPGGYFGDGGTATVAILNHPSGLALDANDNLYIADTGNNVIRKVSGGIITTVAGQAGLASFSGDGGPALQATFNAPSSLTVDAGGSLYISDTGNNVIRRVSGDPRHIITTVAGTSIPGYSGDNEAATSAKLNAPGSLIFDLTGVLTFVDSENIAIREITTIPAGLSFPQTAAGSSATATISVSNIGNEPLHLRTISYPPNFAAGQGGSCSITSPLAGGQSCTLAITYTPSIGGATSGTVNIQSDNLIADPAAPLLGPTIQPFTVLSESKGLYFVPVTPCRVVDTRSAPGSFGAPFLSGNTSRDFSLRNSTSCPGLIPANADVQAYSLNVTAVPHGKLGWLTVYPSATAQPGVSTLNSYDGRTKANAAIIPASLADANRSVSVYASNDTEVILDLNGYYVPAPSNPSALAYYPVQPCRVADTRDASFPAGLGAPGLIARQTRDFPLLSSACGLPAEAQAYALNVTAIPESGPISYLTAWPTGHAQPIVSTLNATTGTTTANAAIVKTGIGGSISVVSTAATDLVIDVNGYYAPPTPNGLGLYTVSPCRAFDSRNDYVQYGPSFPPAVVNIRANCGVSFNAQALVLNATVIPASPIPYLTLRGTLLPTFSSVLEPQSTLNADDGAVTSNLAVVPSGNGLVEAYFGSVSFFNQSRADLLLDLSGYFAP